MTQFVKFALVGIANTLVDLGVLNLLLVIFGIHSTGIEYAASKTISFSAAVTNSYFLNKYWVFRSDPSEAGSRQPTYQRTAFAAVSLIGLVVNSAVAGLAFGAIARIVPTVSPALAANAGALIGTLAVLIFNFFGYKRIVFRPRAASERAS